MSTYAVYEHKTLGKRAVKEGFSAAGLFFPIIWSMYHKLWWLVSILFPWAMFAGATDAIFSNIGGNGLFGAMVMSTLFFHIPAGLIFGFAGNGILRNKLNTQGFHRVGSFEAMSPEDAVGKVISTEVPVTTAMKTPQTSGLSEQISRLNELKQQGVLSEDEFQAAKTKLLT